MSPRGKVLSVEDNGSLWRIFYSPEEGGIDHVLFDHRMFSHFYEGVSGRSFYGDYRSGRGRNIIEEYFKGKTLVVEGEEFEESVTLED